MNSKHQCSSSPLSPRFSGTTLIDANPIHHNHTLIMILTDKQDSSVVLWPLRPHTPSAARPPAAQRHVSAYLRTYENMLLKRQSRRTWSCCCRSCSAAAACCTSSALAAVAAAAETASCCCRASASSCSCAAAAAAAASD